jgi:hypothetical protein
MNPLNIQYYDIIDDNPFPGENSLGGWVRLG